VAHENEFDTRPPELVDQDENLSSRQPENPVDAGIG
jgi:hypothetical protein